MSKNSNTIQNTQSTDFVDIQLLECNRRFSEEVKGGNDNTADSRARFTCKTTEVKVNVGDKVSISNVFCNQRGASSEVIQFEGKPVTSPNSVNYSSTIGYGNYGVEGSPSGRSWTETSEFEETTIPQDNKCQLLINFYKNNNGENHITLPRAWVGKTGIYPASNVIGTDYTTWTENKLENGTTGMPMTYTDQNGGGGGKWYMDIASMLKDDWNYVSFVDEDRSNDNIIIKNQSIDNQRFMLFRVSAPPERLSSLGGYIPPKTSKVFYEHYADADYVNVKDPAGDYFYSPVKSRVNIEIPDGYSDPVNIANSITDQMSKQLSINTQKKTIGGAGKTFTETITSFMETPTCKAFPCGSSSDWSEDWNEAWRDYLTTDSAVIKQKACDYNNNYEMIGFKRPEIVQAIRDNPINPLIFDRNGWELKATILHLERLQPLLVKTNVAWSEENCRAIRHIFDKQALYDELWDWADNDIIEQEGGDISTIGTTAHFYHTWINAQKDFTRYVNIQGTNYSYMPTDYLAKRQFGTDMYHRTGSAQDPPFISEVPSKPLWIDWDDRTHDFWEDSYQQIKSNYGFATKYSDGFNDYIGFHVSGNLNGQAPTPNVDTKNIPNYIFQNYDLPYDIPAGTKIGFDYHFTAFGHGRSIALYSGYLDWYKNQENVVPPAIEKATNKVNYQARGLWDTTGATLHKDLYRFTDHIRQIYIGANAPLLNFDDKASRFDFSNLHMAEAVGNNESAGSEKIDTSPDFLNLVYKINKRSNFYNFCPDLQPYTMMWNKKDFSIDKVGDEIQVVSSSPYLKKYHIYDSHGGIGIQDWGYNIVESTDRYTRNTWKEGLWNKLGYSQNDLNYDSSAEENNFNFRYDNSGNNNNIKVPTTNAVVSIADSFNWVMNFFGNAIMTPQLPISSYLWAMQEATPFVNPAINIVQQSSVLQASSYPQKMENGFFCIRSNIIPQHHYSGGEKGGQSLPVVAVCNKQNAESDFYFSQDGGLEFTATKPFTISEITTSIHKPNQELADLDDNSCVIYKIQKNIMVQTDLISDILNKDKKK